MAAHGRVELLPCGRRGPKEAREARTAFYPLGNAGRSPDLTQCFFFFVDRGVKQKSLASTSSSTDAMLRSRHVLTTLARNTSRQLVHTEAKIAAKGITLPEYQDAMWNYVKGQRDGQLLYIGDHVGQGEDGVTRRGKVGEGGDYTTEEV